MLVVVDANTIFSALLSKGRTFDAFLVNSLLNKFVFVAPEYLFFEIGKNMDEIVERSKLSPEELGNVFRFIKREIDFIPFEEFNRYAEEAGKNSATRQGFTILCFSFILQRCDLV